jgi:two-component system, response regulator YesN
MIKALIVDDEYETRDGLKNLIPWKELGVGFVETACDGAEALELSRHIMPDIIISDIRMPQMNGIAFVEQLKSFLPKSVIIFISGYSDKEYLKSAIEFKAIRYMEKPLDPDEIILAVKEAVDTLSSDYYVNRFLLRDIAIRLTDPGSKLSDVPQKLKNSYPQFILTDQYRSLIFKIGAQGQPARHQSIAEDELKTIEDVLNETFASHIAARLEGAGYYIAHICGQPADNSAYWQDSLQKAMDHISARLEPRAGIFAAVGQYVAGLEHIWCSYKTAVEALRLFFFTGYGAAVYWIQDVESPRFVDPGQIELFESCLKQNDRAGAVGILNALAAETLRYQNTSVDSVRDTFYNLSIHILAVAQDRGLETGKTSESNQDYIWRIIGEMETFNEIYDFVLGRTEAFFESIADIFKNKFAYAIKLYIEKNYADKSLSLIKIANNMHLTTVHICHVFKKETGMTVMQYLTNYRIEKAQALLKLKQIKLVEVADRVGFSDANYFTRSFKKVTGITPSDYRGKYLI